MGAPGDKGQVLCQKCFAFMPLGSEYCAECGAPLSDAPGVGGSDQEVYPELAKANLLRMRKEFKPAEDICLSILRRFPNNASSNTLLGDISAEKGELEHAAEWYELSLDIVPDSIEVKQKLEAVRKELALRQTQATVETLGIPKRQAPVALYAMIGIIVVAFVVAAVAISRRTPGPTGADPNKPLVVGKQPEPKPEVSDVNPTEAPVVYREDEKLARSIAEAAGLGNRVLFASIGDPGDSIRLKLQGSGTDGEWPLRARLVMEAFKLKVGAEKVEIQYLASTDMPAEIKIVERSTYDKTQVADFNLDDIPLLVETLFGYRMEQPQPDAPDTSTVTPPIGDPGNGVGSGGDTSTEGSQGSPQPPSGG